MRKVLVYFAFIAVVFTACTTVKYIPVETVKEIAVHDTTKIHTTDTLVKIPDVSVGDFIDLRDSLRLKADYAEAVAWVDTAHNILAGRLTQTGKIPVKIQWKERTVYRDSIVNKEIPVPVEVEKTVKVIPWFIKIFAWIGFAALMLLAGSFLMLLARSLVWIFARN